MMDGWFRREERRNGEGSVGAESGKGKDVDEVEAKSVAWISEVDGALTFLALLRGAIL